MTEHLSSNVVNYLVWRYLQEAGYAKAALALAHDWHDEPDTLPFADRVQTHAMLRMLQDGMWLDEMRVSASNGAEPRRYQFGQDHGRPFARYNAEARRRKLSSSRRERKATVNGDLADGAQPPRKKKKPSSTTESHVNGDVVMDTNGAPAESEAVITDAESLVEEEVAPLVTTLTLGESSGLQTEKFTNLGPQTTFLRVNEPDTTIVHTEWSPTEPQLLLTAGESLLRIYCIPSASHAQSDVPTEPLFRDLDIGLNHPTVTAVEWTLPGEAVVGTLEDMTADSGERVTKWKMHHLSEGGLQSRLISAVLGNVFALRYNLSANLLISVCSTDVNSRIFVWKDLRREPVYTIQTSQPVFAAEWMSDSTFVVAGDRILEIYEIADGKLQVQKSLPTDTNWETLRFDSICKIIACGAPDNSQFGLILPGDSEIRTHKFEQGHVITGLEFQPVPNPAAYNDDSPRLLATSSNEGFWTLQFWNAKKPFEKIRQLSSGSIVEIAFSPDGYLLAAGGGDTVTFWDPEAGVSKMMWKPAPNDKDQWEKTIQNGAENGRATEELDHALKWDSDGKKLAFKRGNQVAIINFWGMNAALPKA
ncbi:WD40-repeat-containing domain protein [Phyllosticta citricarpa]|uniref:WD40-repeat-containing domain protein n=1 Tax=Phyllosticta citricarpa TaxID=55181 RepID=A0ABR1MM76_9PEZI